MKSTERQQTDVLDLLIQTLMDNEKKMDKLPSELEVLIGYLNGSISVRNSVVRKAV